MKAKIILSLLLVAAITIYVMVNTNNKEKPTVSTSSTAPKASNLTNPIIESTPVDINQTHTKMDEGLAQLESPKIDVATRFAQIYDEKTHAVNLHALNTAINNDEFSGLVEHLTFSNSQSIEFSTKIQQALQEVISQDTNGYVDAIGCYESLCLAQIASATKFTDAQTSKFIKAIDHNNVVQSFKEENGEYIYQYAFSSGKTATVIMSPAVGTKNK
ncbi:hypothetical protein MHM98_01070 [Psychrobium sp. MM17-31]|uniref:hypothetical protein n=1 Tax=Psychrobium sp. MM17-31 TaxID=2917758 RepID=UPI001EF4C7F4|nr:hypothetical protein [Psychrobium sp. MM17-31]MCG7529954.1 hypothetical protein [Psychrobium sp. MM17-31]